ncbi:MAG: DMT family transporter [Nitrospinae bacterium]|nr:DMT family transporter [Nitrospinota bacterium]
MWLIYSLLSAFFVALADALSKKALSTENTILIAWVRFTYAIPFLSIAIPFIELPEFDKTFFIICIILIPLEITAVLLYMQAIKISPLSLTLPFLSLTPVFLILTSYFILGELPDTSGLIGILLVAFGAYLLNIHTARYGILGPLRAVRKEKGSLLMIAVAFIFSITSNLGKIAVQHSIPLFFSVFYTTILSLFLFPIMFFKTCSEPLSNPYYRFLKSYGREELIKLLRKKIFYFIGASYAIMVIFHFTAITLIDVPYMISVKRTSLLFGIALGALFFGETHIKERLIGGIIMIIGVVLISVF